MNLKLFRLLNKVNEKMRLMMKSGLKAHEAWNNCSVDLVRAAEVVATFHSNYR